MSRLTALVAAAPAEPAGWRGSAVAFPAGTRHPQNPADKGSQAVTIQSEFNAKAQRGQDAKRILDCDGRAQRRHRFSTASKASKAAWLSLCGIPAAVQTFAPLRLCVKSRLHGYGQAGADAGEIQTMKESLQRRRNLQGRGVFLTRISRIDTNFQVRQDWHICRKLKSEYPKLRQERHHR